MNMNEIRDFFWPNETARVQKVDYAISKGERIERGVRLYSTQYGSAWSLQIRSPLGIGAFGQRDGKDDVVASVTLSRDDMATLRDQIETFLKDTETP